MNIHQDGRDLEETEYVPSYNDAWEDGRDYTLKKVLEVLERPTYLTNSKEYVNMVKQIKEMK